MSEAAMIRGRDANAQMRRQIDRLQALRNRPCVPIRFVPLEHAIADALYSPFTLLMTAGRGLIQIRDSKAKAGSIFTLSAGAMRAWLEGARRSEFDQLAATSVCR